MCTANCAGPGWTLPDADPLNRQLLILCAVRLRVFLSLEGLVQAGCGHLSFAEAAGSDTYVDNSTPVKAARINYSKHKSRSRRDGATRGSKPGLTEASEILNGHLGQR